jgi:hypothetical protein
MTTAMDSGHFVRFYDTDAQLAAVAAEFLREGFESGAACIVVATRQHRDDIDALLESHGLSPARLDSEYRYIRLDAREVLASLVNERGLDRRRFHASVGLLLRQVSAGGQPLRIFGEMVAILAAEHSTQWAVELEELWNELSRLHAFALLCGYPNALFRGDVGTADRRLICAVHSVAA